MAIPAHLLAKRAVLIHVLEVAAVDVAEIVAVTALVHVKGVVQSHALEVVPGGHCLPHINRIAVKYNEAHRTII